MPLTESVNLVLKNQSVAATDTNIREVSLLLHGDGANGSTTITDSSLSPKTVTAFGNAQISTAQSKFGGSSIAFDGNGDYLRLNGEQDFAFGLGNFTVEFWYYAITNTGNSAIIDTRVSGESANRWIVFHTAATADLQFWASGSTRITTSGASFQTWNHCAVCRSSGQTRMFLNGVVQNPVYTDTNDYGVGAQRPVVGVNLNLLTPLNGYIDELRITKAARYTANFTPPTAPFPDF